LNRIFIETRISLLALSCINVFFFQTIGGILLREVILRQDMKNPLHAIQLANDLFLVCHGSWGKSYNVVVVGIDGKRIGYFHDQHSSNKDIRELKGSSSAVVASGGKVLVCEWDRTTSRILMLNRSLSGAKDLLVSVDQPWAICLDEGRDRLYVGEQKGGRVLVFDRIFSTQELESSA
jgi:hypothetical protein